MLNIGDLIIYTSHGICRIDDISSMKINGVTKKYYVLHPIENDQQQLTINAPVDNDKIKMMKLINKDEAEKILESFDKEGAEWIDNPNLRSQTYKKVVNSGDRFDIAKVVNTLIKKKHELESNGKKFYEQDHKHLTNIQDILFKELALALDLSTDEIHQKINKRLLKAS
ncbi:CarD family transcriptional regulator [Alkalibacillus silvisoli]|uniref:CarD-like/TRCF RNAP-interacting domain-containing protein n=1 Tax=Alkalibacillus silvisoli TaxID=392823 RepID=A0ABN1AB81_9BACI